MVISSDLEVVDRLVAAIALVRVVASLRWFVRIPLPPLRDTLVLTIDDSQHQRAFSPGTSSRSTGGTCGFAVVREMYSPGRRPLPHRPLRP